MIRVLNKKIIDRDTVIEKLQIEMKILEGELEVYKDG